MTNPFLRGIASGLHSYAQGGVIPDPSDTMPNMNGYYPLSNIQRHDAAYDPQLSFSHPSELLGSGDTNIDPFTGEEKFDVGGAVAGFDPNGTGYQMPWDLVNPSAKVAPAYATDPVPPGEMKIPLSRDMTSASSPTTFARFQPGFSDGQMTDDFGMADDSRMWHEAPDQPYMPTYGDDSSRGLTTPQPWINPPDASHPLPAFQSQTGGIGPYVDNLNKEFAAGPRYKTNPGVDWTTPGGTYVGGTGGGGGGGGGGDGGDGGGIGGIDKWGPGALVLGGKVYKNWDEIKAAWDKLTHKEDRKNTDTTETTDPEGYGTEITYGAPVASTVGNAATNTGRAGSVEAHDDVTNEDGTVENEGYGSEITNVAAPAASTVGNEANRTGEVTVYDDPANLEGYGSGLANTVTNTAIESAGPTSSVTVDDPANLEGYGSEISNASPGTGGIASLGGSAAGALANTIADTAGDKTGQVLVGDAAEAVDQAGGGIASLGGAAAGALANTLANTAGRTGQVLVGDAAEAASNIGSNAASNAASTATSGAAGTGIRSTLDNVTDAIHGLKLDIGGTSDIGKMLSGNTGSILNSANLAGNIGSLGLNVLASKIGQNDLAKYGGMVGSFLGGPLGNAAVSTILNPIGAIIQDIQGIKTPITNPLTGEQVTHGPMYDKLQEFYARQGEVQGAAQKPMSVEETLKLMQDAESGNITNANADQYFGIGAKDMGYSELIDAYLKDGGDPSAIGAQFASYMPKKAAGGPINYAAGGLASLPEYKAGGLLNGPGDGMSDSIPAVIKGQQPQRAALADGEFVVPADVVSHLGNGSTKAGSARLYEMMDKIRHARTGNPKQGKKINPHKFLPV